MPSWAIRRLRAPSVRADRDVTATTARNPLLATWGRDAREMQLVLRAGTAQLDGDHMPISDEHLAIDGTPITLLSRLQADVRADIDRHGPRRPGGAGELPCLDPGDRSLQVHSCHGRARQVEVLRDAILHLFASDPTLEARDVIVMCPDIDTFAPLIHATFGLARPDDGAETTVRFGAGGAATAVEPRPPGHELRVRLADRSLRQTNPLLSALSQLLALASARVTASQVLDLAGTPPVRRRFSFDDDDLVRINEWVAAAGIRWGIDAAHRAPWLLGEVEAGTWRAGLRRILLGAAMSEDDQRLVGGVLPLDDVDSGDIDLAGRLAEFVDRLASAIRAFSQELPIAGWVSAIRLAADGLFATTAAGEWQRGQLHAVLDDVAAEAAGGPIRAVLSVAEVQALLADRLRGRPTRANFRTGHLTMCTLVPMRSVPHRVVCLLGLDDGVFPRRTMPDGDDLIGREPWVGDRDIRSEDRQLLLDALLAAGDHLVITYSGRDERTNAVRPPAVPLGELLDVVDRTVRLEADVPGGGEGGGGGSGGVGSGDAARGADGPTGTRLPRHRVVTEHPLHPYDARNFITGSLIPGRPWGFDTVALAGAAASVAPRSPVTAFLGRPLPAALPDPVEIDDLVRFVQHPVKAFLRQRLGVVLRDDDDEPDDALPIDPDGLGKWAVGTRLLEGRLLGLDAGVCAAAEMARGTIPPDALGLRVLAEVMPNVDQLMAAADARAGAGPANTVDIKVPLGDGRTLVGTVGGVAGDVVRAVIYSRLAPKHRLAAWVRVLALTATYPERPFRAVTIGRGPGQRCEVSTAVLASPDQDHRRAQAVAHLTSLVDLYDRGLREPIPLYCDSSAAYAAHGGNAARATWTTDWDFSREDRDPAHQLVLSGSPPFVALFDARPRPDEAGLGWANDEPSRFGRLAHRLWDGLLANEEISR